MNDRCIARLDEDPASSDVSLALSKVIAHVNDPVARVCDPNLFIRIPELEIDRYTGQIPCASSLNYNFTERIGR